MKQLHQTLSFFSLVTLTAFAFITTSCSKKSDDKGNNNPPNNDKETVIFTENFDNPNTSFWKTATNDMLDIKVSGGFFSVTCKGTKSPVVYKHWSAQKLFGANDKKQAVEIAIQHVAGTRFDSGGILFAVKDNTNLFHFTVLDQFKKFDVYSINNGILTQLIKPTASSAIKGGLNEVNILRVTLVDGKLTFYINGTEVGVLQAEGVTSLDLVGNITTKGDTPEATYKVDYVKAITLK
jgi:hypothetical protein